jgi:catechol 2,3-dioxygenase-like lactoylglutathione lyase family enzyme
MLDHLVLSVSDLERSVAFYEQALKPLGVSHYVDFDGHPGHADLKGFGQDRRADFWLRQSTPSPTSAHFGFIAKSPAEVDAFHRAALAAGGVNNGGPGARNVYDPGYYAAYVLDPDGYNVEAVHKS